MTPDLADAVIRTCAEDVKTILNRAEALARAATESAGAGDRAQTIQLLLEAEPLIWDARGLINCASLIARRTQPDIG